jgi:hypothetical protein
MARAARFSCCALFSSVLPDRMRDSGVRGGLEGYRFLSSRVSILDC